MTLNTLKLLNLFEGAPPNKPVKQVKRVEPNCITFDKFAWLNVFEGAFPVKLYICLGSSPEFPHPLMSTQ